MTNRSRLIVGLAGVLVVFFGILMLTVWDTYQIVPGGPNLQPFPDLIVESIQYKGSEDPLSSCTGVHMGTFNVTVTIRNAGAKPADLPFGKSWVVIWSVIGGTAPPFKQWITAPPEQLAAGQAVTLTKKVSAMASVTAEKKYSLTFAVMADPDQVIPESNEDNNFKNQETVYTAFCPPP